MSEQKTTAIAEYSATEAALAELRTKYEAAVFDVTTGKGLTAAKQARAELRGYRVALESKRQELKAPILERGRMLDSEAKRITAEIEALEGPIDQAIKAEEHRKEREREAKEQAERERVAAINAKFDAIKGTPLRAVNATVEQIDAVIAEVEATDIVSFPADLQSAANYEVRVAVASLRAARDARVAHDGEQERVKAEREELSRLRAEQEAVAAERERLAAAERERVAAEERAKAEAERQAREASEAAARAEREQQEAIARAEREAAERSAREAREAEQARIDAERAEQRRKEDAERAKAAEKLRREQQALAEQRARMEAEAVVERKARRDAEIASATLHGAAEEALAFLRSKGYGDELVTLKLAAAINREPMAEAA